MTGLQAVSHSSTVTAGATASQYSANSSVHTLWAHLHFLGDPPISKSTASQFDNPAVSLVEVICWRILLF